MLKCFTQRVHLETYDTLNDIIKHKVLEKVKCVFNKFGQHGIRFSDFSDFD